MAEVRNAVGAASRTTLTLELEGGSAAELLRDGLAYDLLGLSPGPPVGHASARHAYGFAGEPPPTDTLEAIALRPGDHIAAGARAMPVVRTLAGIAAELAPHLPGLEAIAWPPAATLIGPSFFASTVAKWLDGGAFPALGLTAFAPDEDGGLRSEGLAWFGAQEIVLDPALAEDRAAATRLAIRLVNQLAGRGALGAAELVVGPDGERLLLEPGDGGVLRVRRG
jgi:hypothetical protein